MVFLFVHQNLRFCTCGDLTAGIFFTGHFWVNQKRSLTLSCLFHSVKVTEKGMDLHVYNAGPFFKDKKLKNLKTKE